MSSKKILLVEDNLVNTEVAIDMIEMLESSADVVENGLKAAEICEKNQYDLILMDCEMPVMNGFDASRQIRKNEYEQQRRQVPIIALTAHTMSGAKEKCIECGMNDFLAKPFSIADLRLILNKWLSSDSVADEAIDQHEQASEYSAGSEAINTTTNTTDKTPVLDHAVLEKIYKIKKNGSSSLLNRVITIYLDQTSSLLIELKDGVSMDDAESVRKITHTLKSSSINVGATGLSGLCKEVELICGQGKIDTILVDKIHTTYYEVEKALNSILSNSDVT